MAVTSMVTGIAGVALGWVPFVFVLAACSAVVAIVFGVLGLKAARANDGYGRDFAIAGLALAPFALAACVGGFFFTRAVVHEFRDFVEPGPHELFVDQPCKIAGGVATLTGRIHNLDDRSHDYRIVVKFASTDDSASSTAFVDNVAAGKTASWSASADISGSSISCSVTDVSGPDALRHRAAELITASRLSPTSRLRTSANRCPPAANNSAWGPSSTSRPCSSTITRSARAAVDSRWAIAIVVRPAASLSSARPMRTSVRASTDDVASSSTRTAGSTSDARTRATSCRSPADSCDPRAPTSVARPSGRVSSQSLRSRSTMACLQVCQTQHRSGEAEVGGDRAVEEERLLGHDHEPSAQLVVGHRGEGYAADAHAADGGIGEARDQSAQRGLARTGLADHSDVLARRDLRGDVDEHGLFVVVIATTPIAERDVLDADAAARRPGA